MKTTKIIKLLETGKNILTKQSPNILMGFGVFGICMTFGLLVVATKKAVEDIDEEIASRAEKFDEEEDVTLTKTETVVLVWRHYIPAAVMGTTSLACIIGAHAISLKRQAALMGLYSMSEAALKKYQDSMKPIKTGSEEVDKLIESNPAPTDLGECPKGDVLCYEKFTGRYFYSNRDKLKAAELAFKLRLIEDYSASLNELYDLVNSDQLAPCDAGDAFGWTTENLMEFDCHSKLTADGVPCMVVDFRIGPSAMWRC